MSDQQARGEAVNSVLGSDQSEALKSQALAALGQPTPQGTNVVWYIIVGGLVLVLVIAALALTHWFGDKASDDKMVTIITTIVAGLLGLVAPSPVAGGGGQQGR